MKLSDRHSLESLAKGSQGDVQGRMFFNDYGIHDLSDVEIVGASVDTVRQLYYGQPKQAFIDQVENHAGDYIRLLVQTFEGLRRPEFHLVRMGKVSRYRWKLQNNELGVVILFGSYFSKMEKQGQHLKIELSPKFISQRNPQTIMDWLNHVSQQILDDSIPKGCAVHLACDFQGYELPVNFLDVFQTRCKIIKSYDGLNTLDIGNLSESIATYGKGDNRNYLIGKPGGIQMCFYDKTKEVIKSDKVDYFNEEWQTYSFGIYDPEKFVKRIEMRVSHTVVREIGQGIGVELESFLAVSDYLTDIWRYALKSNRLLMVAGAKLINPFWQLLMEDVFFVVPAQNVAIKRKKKDDVAAIARNVSMLLGNLISICARKGLSSMDVKVFLKKTLVYPQILEVYEQRGLNEDDLTEFIDDGLRRRRLIGKAA